jgi:type II secretory pathway predicted ATPase ExeA
MTEALRDIPSPEQMPFADETAGREYFESEPHYRLLAATIHGQLQQRQRIVLVTGDPAPNGESLARQLIRDAAPRCRATAIKGAAQTRCDGLMNSYRKMLGISIAEESLKRAAGVSQPIPFPRGHDLDILVLENADALEDDVLEELCLPGRSEDEHRPALVLLAREAMLTRLKSASLDAVDDAIAARLRLQDLMPTEVAPFIRCQMEAAHLAHLDIFKAPVLELIGLYADGDPSAVNELARRVLSMVQRLGAKTSAAETADPPLPEQPVARINALAPEPPASLADDEVTASAPPAAAASVPESLVVAPAAQISAAVATDPVTEIAAPPPGEPSAPILESPAPADRETDAVLVADMPATEEQAPIASELAETEAAPDEAAIVVAPLERKPSTWTVELPRSFDPIEESPLPEPSSEAPVYPAPDLPDDAQAFAEESEESAESVASESAEGSVGENTVSASEESAAPLVENGTMLDAPIEAAAEESEAPLVAPSATLDDDVARYAEEEGRTAIAKRPRRLRRLVASGVLVVLAALALVIGFDAGHVRSIEPLRLNVRIADFMTLVQDLRRRVEAAIPSPTTNSASVSVAKEPASQPLRTTTQDTKTELLLTDTANSPSGNPNNSDAATVPLPTLGPIIAPPPVPANSGETKVVIAPPPEVPPPAPAAELPAVAAPPKTIVPAKRDAAAATAPAAPSRPAPDQQASAGGDSNQLLIRGDQLLARGDIIAARHYFELVTEAGDLRAALRLGKTYDPAFLKQLGVRGIAGDPAMAKSWYLKAIASGDKDADLRLLQLMALYPE